MTNSRWLPGFRGSRCIPAARSLRSSKASICGIIPCTHSAVRRQDSVRKKQHAFAQRRCGVRVHATHCGGFLRKQAQLSNSRATCRRRKPYLQAVPDVAEAAPGLVPLGLDFLTFLAATVLVLPIFRSAKISPVLGFLFTGLVLGQLGLFRNLEEIEKLSELGVLFLLFEMGLELSFDRLKALSKYAFGLGGLSMLLTTVAFTSFALPVGQGLGTMLLTNIFNAPLSLVSIRSFDEAVVIAAALSLSSSAFVLSILNEKGDLSTKYGSATLGILLFQDIAVVPCLVLLPLIESSSELSASNGLELIQAFGPTVLTTLGWVGVLIVGGRTVLRRVFEMVAESRSDEAFFALCLLTVTGAALLTEKLGFSDTLGAFVAGILLSETSYRTRVEADIEPFKGILLGLFFVTTGSSFDVPLFLETWPIVLAMVTGLIAIKTLVFGVLSPLFGLSRGESIRTAFLLSQGGEFAFVLLALANQLEILPAELNKLLIMVVVMSMALTPLLADFGKYVADTTAGSKSPSATPGGMLIGKAPTSDPVVICGFCDLGQMVANMLETAPPGVNGGSVPYIAFDLTVPRLEAAQEVGFNVVYGDGSNMKVLRATGVEQPRAIVVVYRARARAVNAVRSLREAFPLVPIYARALDLIHAAEVQAAGATSVVTADTEAGLMLGARLLKGMGAQTNELKILTKLLRKETDGRATYLSEQLRQEEESSSMSQVFRLEPPRLGPPADQDGVTTIAEGPVSQSEAARAPTLEPHVPTQSELDSTSEVTSTAGSGTSSEVAFAGRRDSANAVITAAASAIDAKSQT